MEEENTHTVPDIIKSYPLIVCLLCMCCLEFQLCLVLLQRKKVATILDLCLDLYWCQIVSRCCGIRAMIKGGFTNHKVKF